jgi:hypothetical protein
MSSNAAFSQVFRSWLDFQNLFSTAPTAFLPGCKGQPYIRPNPERNGAETHATQKLVSPNELTNTAKWLGRVSLARLGLVAVGMFLAMSNALAAVHYVSAGNTNATPPYTNWATAAGDIQDAVNAAGAGDEILVTNGSYGYVAMSAPLTLQSVNGPDVTTISGGAVEERSCVYLVDKAVLAGFTVSYGYSTSGGGVSGGVATNCVLEYNMAWHGGGAAGCTLNNCTLIGNSANGYPVMAGEPYTLNYYGGGAEGCTLNNCILTGNFACYGPDNPPGEGCPPSGPGAGGGAFGCTLNNCTLTGNEVKGVGGSGGGAHSCTLNNSILAGNSASNYGGGAYFSTLNNCVLDDNSDSNGGNDSYNTLNDCYTTAPLFLDDANGNFRLQSSSPCINAGNNAFVVGGTDLDGNPRVVGGTVDIGAYEYQSPVSRISYAWLQQYGLSIATNTDTADLDGTGFNVYQDWIAGLNPTDPSSVLQMLAPVDTNNPAGVVVRWQSVNTRTYCLQRGTNLTAQPAFSTIQSNLAGQAGTTTYTDTNAAGSGPFFYRVGVEQ